MKTNYVSLMGGMNEIWICPMGVIQITLPYFPKSSAPLSINNDDPLSELFR